MATVNFGPCACCGATTHTCLQLCNCCISVLSTVDVNVTLPTTWYKDCDDPVTGATPTCLGSVSGLQFNGINISGSVITGGWSTPESGLSVEAAPHSPCGSFFNRSGVFAFKDVRTANASLRCVTIDGVQYYSWFASLGVTRYVQRTEGGEWEQEQFVSIFISPANEPFFGEEDYCMWDYDPVPGDCCKQSAAPILSMDWLIFYSDSDFDSGSGTQDLGLGTASIELKNNKCCRGGEFGEGPCQGSNEAASCNPAEPNVCNDLPG